MADNYFARGVAECETNLHEECFQSHSKQYNRVMTCLKMGLITSPDSREALAYASMGNGCMAIDKFAEAEEWYLKAFDVWDRLASTSKDRQLYVSI
jgi:hypothetical protein